MKFLPFCGLLIGVLTPALAAQEPTLSTPGTATWATESTTGGWRTIFTIRDNTVLDWTSLNLPRGSELVFDFLGGQSVLNYLGGSGVNRIDGTVASNGIVAFFSPRADLVVGGDITAGGVILSTLDADPVEVFGGQGFQMAAAEAGLGLTIRGQVTATSGDVLLASEQTNITGRASIEAAGAVRIAGTDDVNIGVSGEQRLGSNSSDGFVLHLGETRAPTIEVVAGGEIQHFGTLDAGDGKILLEVGRTGRISAGGSAVIVGEQAFEQSIQFTESSNAGFEDGDAVQAISDATLKLPALKRPDGSTVSSSRTISYSAPMSASSDAGRPAKKRKVEKVAQASDRRPLLRRSSLFSMRGGSTKVEKR